ncbi:MAG TPA: hypothetical protein VFI22_11165, partial [Thermomicrobiales bacterium]|nr:hypothetical protein [Thermomicrobiales bacterium]
VLATAGGIVANRQAASFAMPTVVATAVAAPAAAMAPAPSMKAPPAVEAFGGTTAAPGASEAMIVATQASAAVAQAARGAAPAATPRSTQTAVDQAPSAWRLAQVGLALALAWLVLTLIGLSVVQRMRQRPE